MSERTFFPTDLRTGDLIVVEKPVQAWLVMEVAYSKDRRKVKVVWLPTHKHPAAPVTKIIRADLKFPLHYQLLRRNTSTMDLEEVECSSET